MSTSSAPWNADPLTAPAQAVPTERRGGPFLRDCARVFARQPSPPYAASRAMRRTRRRDGLPRLLTRGPARLWDNLKVPSRLAILLTVAVLTIGLLPAGALAAAPHRDTSSTHTALLAAYTTLRAVVNTWPTEEASFHMLDQKFAAECPDVGAGSPQNEPEQRLSYEVAGALWATGYHTDAGIARAFIRTVSPLRWSNPALARRMNKFITGLREMIALQVPDLCGDVRAWTASGYQTIPESTLRYDQHVEAINVEVPSPRMLAPYIQPSERGLLTRVQHLITRFEELEFVTGQRSWIALLEVLGLNE